MFNPYDEFPHEIQIKRELVARSRAYPFKQKEGTQLLAAKGFMDTPSTSEKLEYKTADIQLSRMLYVPFNTFIKPTDYIVFENVEYAIVGDCEDQGGQHEVLRIPLSRR